MTIWLQFLYMRRPLYSLRYKSIIDDNVVPALPYKAHGSVYINTELSKIARG